MKHIPEDNLPNGITNSIINGAGGYEIRQNMPLRNRRRDFLIEHGGGRVQRFATNAPTDAENTASVHLRQLETMVAWMFLKEAAWVPIVHLTQDAGMVELLCYHPPEDLAQNISIGDHGCLELWQTIGFRNADDDDGPTYEVCGWNMSQDCWTQATPCHIIAHRAFCRTPGVASEG